MIYRTKYHALLKSNDPPCAAVGGEFIQMRPLNRLRDEPGTEASLAKVLDLMKEDKDWNNFPEFLSCLRMANRKLRDWQVEKIARRACMAGKEDVLLECVRRVKRTRISLGDVNVARELMWVAMRRTQVGSWKESHIQRGINLAEQLWVMMHDPSHSKEHEPGIVRPLGRPEIIGVLVQLHAAKASMCKNGQDEEGKVKKYVEILLAVWKDSEPSINEGDWSDANHKLLLWSPVLHGIKMARQVLGEKSGNGKALKVKLDALEPLLQKARDLVLAHQPDDSPRRGLKVYEELSSVSS